MTGGCCAVIYSHGDYESEDIDLILRSAPSQRDLDKAMAAAGFQRVHDHYVHPRTDFFVEFPRGPLAIGRDVRITPRKLAIGKSRIEALSPTDSCRDRLAAYYFWNDRQALEAAINIALRNPLNLEKVRKWSHEEGMGARYTEFLRKLSAARSQGTRKKARRR